MTIKTFEDIVAWRKSKDLCIDYSFRDQIFRAAISVMNNIAEGYERNGNKEFRNFLFIAKGSCGELRSMLHIALELKYITRGQYDKLLQESITISKMLSGLIKAL